MGKGGALDWMIEREKDKSGRAWRRKNSKERETGVSEWKSAGIWAWPRQKGVKIAEKRKGREMWFVYSQRKAAHFKHSNHHPSPPLPITQPLYDREG